MNTVLAAYVNYGLADSPGSFNTPAVLLADAVIFAFGGAHLELGEHMLGKEYYPSNNLEMSQPLQESLTGYYDFLVGYQNLLRDGGQFSDNRLNSSNATLNMWPAQQGSVSVVNKVVGNREIFHLINFTDAAHMNWRDNAGNQAEPAEINGIELTFFSHKPVGKLWVASPDEEGGVPVELGFSQASDGMVSVVLPSLRYWSMLVAEAGPFTGWDDSSDAAYAGQWNNGSNGGSGFGPWQLASYNTSGGYAGFWLPDDSGEGNGIDNAGAVERDSGTTWASFANKGSGIDQATAYRTFDTPLQVAGDRFTVTLENGAVEGRVGVALRNGNATATPGDYDTGARMQFFFEGGNSNYSLLDGSGLFDTGIGWTPYGLKIDFTLTGTHTYDLVIWRYDEANDVTPQVFNIQGRTLSGTGAIESLALFQYDAAGGGIQSDVFFNYLGYSIAGLAGDFDHDGDVDGRDFLKWQRGESPDPRSQSDLDAWILNFGSTSDAMPHAVSVPEPKTFLLLLFGALPFGSRLLA